jgi:hypothetical protein
MSKNSRIVLLYHCHKHLDFPLISVHMLCKLCHLHLFRGLVVRVPDYSSRGPGPNWGPLSLVSAIEELLERNSSGSVP